MTHLLDRTFDGLEIEVLIDPETLAERIDSLAQEVARDYAHLGEEPLTTVTVLQGAKAFSDALRARLTAYGRPTEDVTIRLGSYGDATESSGHVRVVEDLSRGIEGRHALVVEDIVDSGLSMKFLRPYLLSRAAQDVRICALLDKPAGRHRDAGDLALEYVGFSIPKKFVIGFGLDYQQKHRDLPYIGAVRI